MAVTKTTSRTVYFPIRTQRGTKRVPVKVTVKVTSRP
jgi:hypothetical protein